MYVFVRELRVRSSADKRAGPFEWSLRENWPLTNILLRTQPHEKEKKRYPTLLQIVNVKYSKNPEVIPRLVKLNVCLWLPWCSHIQWQLIWIKKTCLISVIISPTFLLYPEALYLEISFLNLYFKIVNAGRKLRVDATCRFEDVLSLHLWRSFLVVIAFEITSVWPVKAIFHEYNFSLASYKSFRVYRVQFHSTASVRCDTSLVSFRHNCLWRHISCFMSAVATLL